MEIERLEDRQLLSIGWGTGGDVPADDDFIAVDASATGANDGSSWADAYVCLQDALTEAQPGDVIWVAEGTYQPDNSSAHPGGDGDRAATFQLESGVTIYGGFPVGGGSWQQRDPATCETVLSGDLGGNDGPDFTGNAENSIHVVTGSGCDETAVLDGFTVTGGNADGEEWNDKNGGGIFVYFGAPTLSYLTVTENLAEYSGGGMAGDARLSWCTFRGNVAQRWSGGISCGDSTLDYCTIEDNWAGDSGGGITTGRSTLNHCVVTGNYAGYRGGGIDCGVNAPTLNDCTITGNSAGTIGGGIDSYEGSPILIDCLLADNSAPDGGAIAMGDCRGVITACRFLGNSADTGGGISAYGYSIPTLVNCEFSGNVADSGGGIYNTTGSRPTLVNCTFSRNSATADGGGMEIYNNYEFSPLLTNCIFWGNQDGSGNGEPAQIHYQESAPVVNYCTVQGWTGDLPGTGNLDADPLPVDADGADDVVGTADDDLRLRPGSPCIDAADNTAVPPTIVVDLAGGPRFLDDPSTVDTGSGTPPVVDMGAYEFQPPHILYVDVDATGTGNGTSWVNAFTDLPSALSTAAADASVEEIWVAQGVYTPAAPGGDRATAFQLLCGVALKGGFAGFGESDPNARDADAYQTVLSGDLNGDDGPGFAGNGENSYHVVTGSGADETAVLEGFVLIGGNADGPAYEDRWGGGLYSGPDGSPTIVDCTFRMNWAEDRGGGIFTVDGRPALTDCVFFGNRAGLGGGLGGGAGTLSGCTFSQNTADIGGGIWGGGSSGDIATWANCTFLGNLSTYGGAGAFANNDVQLVNCTFSGNSTDTSGGGMLAQDCDVTLTNCTFSRNAADSHGGFFNDEGLTTATNCIFWGNSDAGGAGQSAQFAAFEPPVVNHTCIQGWTGSLGGSGNFGDDPLLADADGADNYVGTADDDLRLLLASPCIDAGDNAAVPPSVVADLDGYPRIVGGTVDMGAYEFVDPLPIFVGDRWQYFKGTEEPPADWNQPRFDDSAWAGGPTGIGYGDGDDATLLDDMQGSYVSVYARRLFRVDLPSVGHSHAPPNGRAALDRLVLTIDYDDAFVAYLNGIEVARNNVDGDPPAFDTRANENHEASAGNSDPNPPEEFDISAFVDRVVVGVNVLAIQGHNLSSTSTDFSLIPSLVAAPPALYVDDDAPGDPGAGNPDVSDPLENGSRAHPFDAIQEAIDAAADGNVVIVLDGRYTGSGNRDVDFLGKAITVRSENGPENCVIDCQQVGRGFVFHSGEGPDSVLDGLTITRGNALALGPAEFGGAVCVQSASPTLCNNVLVENRAFDGGGLYYDGDGLVENNRITGNTASRFGGGMSCDWAAPTIRGNTIADNQAEDGGGIFTRGTPSILENTISGNQAARSGGGIMSWEDYAPVISGNTVSENAAGQNGGGIALFETGATITDNTIAGNSAASGGGIHCQNLDSVEIARSAISGNVAYNGGGVFIAAGAGVTLRDCTISGNRLSGEGYGGGIHCAEWATPLIVGCLLTGNSGPDGAAIACLGDSNAPGQHPSATIRDCTIARNVGYNGAAVHAYSADPVIEHCTIVGNESSGGTIYAYYHSAPTVVDSIVWDNLGGSIGGYESTPAVTYSDIEGGFAGEGNISVDPQFAGYGPAESIYVDAAAVGPGDGSPEHPYQTIGEAIGRNGMEGYSLRLADGSPCVGTGQGGVNMGADHGTGGPAGAGAVTMHVAASAYDFQGCSLFYRVSLVGAGAEQTTLLGVVSGLRDETRLQSVMVTGPDAAGILLHLPGTATIEDCTVTGVPLIPGGAQGAIECRSPSTPTIFNCTVAENEGVGIQAYTAGTTIIGCTIRGNAGRGISSHGASVTDCLVADNGAAGIYSGPGSNAPITGCTITGNAGVGIQCWYSSPTISNCTITDNQGETGGGIYCGWHADPTIINCVIADNQADYGGAIGCWQFSGATVINSTLADNHAPYGGGVSCDSPLHSQPNEVLLSNCILRNDGEEIYIGDGSQITVNYSDVQGGWTGPGEGNIDADPLFVGLGDDPYHLRSGSPCIDAADNTAVPPEVVVDLDGNPRFADDADTPDTGHGTPPIVDMGAYEFGAASLPGEIRGRKWSDLDADGQWDPDEPGLPGWKIYVDVSQNDRWDEGEPYGLTDTDGYYAITGLPPGTYTVAEVPRPGWEQTYPDVPEKDSADPQGVSFAPATGSPGGPTGSSAGGPAELDAALSEMASEPVDVDTSWIDGSGPSALKNLDWPQPDLQPQVEGTAFSGTGVFDVYVEAGLLAAIDVSLSTYVADLTREGYQVSVQEFAGTSGELRAQLRSRWISDALEGALFVGDLPYQVFTSEDNFESTPQRVSYLHDLYFMDLDGSYVFNPGGLDEHTDGSGNVEPEIYVSRITTGNLGGLTGLDEATLINRYFAKVHAYRTGRLTYENRGIVFADDDWDHWGASQMQALYDEVLGINDPADTTRQGYLDTLELNYESILEALHSGPTSHSVRVGDSWQSVSSSDVVGANPRQAFYNMFNCSGARFTANNYLAGAYVYGGDYGLNALGSTKTGSMLSFPDYYRPQGEGDSVGQAFMQWFDRYAAGTDSGPDTYVDWFYGMTMQGDPTLRPASMPGSPVGIHTVQLASGQVVRDVNFGNHAIAPATVAGRHVFYNGSFFDGEDLQASPADDDAIAVDKTALLPGQTATFANYTSYSRGINGIMVDIAGLPPVDGAVEADNYFELRVGNDNQPGGWEDAPDPTRVTVRPGAGVDDSDRITLVWPDNAIQKQWLRVVALANEHTGLAKPDVFYFGNAIGESGNSPTDAKVNAFDMLGARDNQRNFIDPAPIDFPYDYNRDARVNAYDMLIARDNQTHFLNALRLITVPAAGKTTGQRNATVSQSMLASNAILERVPLQESRTAETSSAKLDWLYEFEEVGTYGRPSEAERSDRCHGDTCLIWVFE